MIVFIASAISFLLLAVSGYQIFRAVSAPESRKEFCLAVLFGAVAATMGIGCVTGSETDGLLMLETLPALALMLVLESSLGERMKIAPAVYAVAGFYILPAGFHIAVALGWASLPADVLIIVACTTCLILPSGIFIFAVCRHIRDVKMILKAGTVWANLSLAVEALYLLLYLLLDFLYLVLFFICPDQCRAVLLVFPFLAGLMLAALGIRRADDVLFVFWRAQERRVVESMKVTKVETAMDPLSIEDVYQDIYERVVAYFEAEKPFLNNELTINDLSKALYSNKLYLSRAISQFTGRNFCQFVNYYRVTYSMELFRKDHNLKIQELAIRSGFNSDVSYNMAFRLFMGETPGEWCKKERNRKIKMKK